VEVLNGNQSSHNLARRRSDRQEAPQRALTWLMRDGDIVLYPHSPLALADVLAAENGGFDLIADHGQPAYGDDDLTVAQNEPNAPGSSQSTAAQPSSLQQRRQRKHPRSRANLLTQLSQADLIACCKSIQVENALVKRAGVKRLYLTAGFLHFTDSDEHSLARRAPILFYPATLIRKAHLSDEQFDTNSANTASGSNEDNQADIRYEIRIEGPNPDINKALRDWCTEHAEFVLPEFNPDLPLQDYFAQIAQSISEVENVELQFDIALGNAAPPLTAASDTQNQAMLPALPELFDCSLAKAITDNKNLQQLHSVLNLIKDYRTEVGNEQTLPGAANEATGAVSNLHEYSKKLSGAGLSRVEFQHLPGLPDNLLKWIGRVTEAMESKLVTEVLDLPGISARHLIRLAGVIELIDKAPLTIDQFKHSDLCFSTTPALLQRAKHQASLIEDELSTLQNTFVLDKVPAKKQLLSLIGELGGSLDEEPDIVDADYFNARRQFMEFSIEKPTSLTPEHRSLLGKLAKVLRFRELFVNNVEYRMALGPGYRGLRTDWNVLGGAVEYAQEISEVLESESIAANALGQWNDFRTTYTSELEILQKAADALRKLLWICGSEWQNKATSDVLKQADQTRMKLLAWSDVYGPVETGNSNTPGKVLAQFSGKSQEDVLTEIHVGETQATIDEHLSGGKASADSVVETIEWLRQASQTASDLDLEINAIVAHLNIA